MPACNVPLNLYQNKNSALPAMRSTCVFSEGHKGPHEWHVWSDAHNKATSGQGIMMVLKGSKAAPKRH